MTLQMTRFRAFVTHLVLSLLIFVSVVLLVGLVWYPGVFFEASGVWSAMRTVALVDVVLGPLLTLVLFKPGKPGLKFDISVVAGLQLLALIYGVSVLYTQKPELLVFDRGMFYCMNQQQVEYAGVPDPVLKTSDSRRDSGARVAVALFPELSAEQQQRWQSLKPQLPVNYPKLPAFAMGELLIPYEQGGAEILMRDAWNLAGQIKYSEQAAAAWQDFVKDYGSEHDWHQGLRFFPLTCGFKQYMVAVEPDSATLETLLRMSFINARQYKLMPPASE